MRRGKPWSVPYLLLSPDQANAYTMKGLSDFYAPRSRFLYTEQRGPIDLRHFFAAASQAILVGEVDAIARGRLMEHAQSLLPRSTGWGSSAWNWEDLTSNELGAAFGQQLRGRVLTPDEIKTEFTDFMNNLGAGVLPQKLAPYLADIPDSKAAYEGNPLRDHVNNLPTSKQCE